MNDTYNVGQAWNYEAPRGFEQSRIVIGAILTFAQHEPVICAAVTGAPMLDAQGKVKAMTIPFLPFSKTAFDQTVIGLAGDGDVPEGFQQAYQRWKTDDKGFGYIDVPFKGLLKNMVTDLSNHASQQACIHD